MFGKKHRITFEVAVCVENDGDGFHAYCPALAGVHVDGNTEQEAIENVREAVFLYITSLIKHNDPIPIHIVRSIESQEKHPDPADICPPQQMENILVTV